MLMSIRKLIKDNDCLITFDAFGFVIKNKQGQSLGKGHKNESLYALNEKNQQTL